MTSFCKPQQDSHECAQGRKKTCMHLMCLHACARARSQLLVPPLSQAPLPFFIMAQESSIALQCLSEAGSYRLRWHYYSHYERHDHSSHSSCVQWRPSHTQPCHEVSHARALRESPREALVELLPSSSPSPPEAETFVAKRCSTSSPFGLPDALVRESSCS